jgi:hypothetical protein
MYINDRIRELLIKSVSVTTIPRSPPLALKMRRGLSSDNALRCY